MGLQFQAPQFVKPRDYSGLARLGSLDGVINSYIQSKMAGVNARQQQDASMAHRLGLIAEYGIDPSALNPQQFQQAQQPLPIAPQPGQGLGLFQNPGQPMQPPGEHPNVAALRGLMEQSGLMRQIKERKSRASLSGAEARAERDRAEADYLRNLDPNAAPSISTDPDTGLQFLSQSTRGGTRYQPIPGQVPTYDEKTKGVLAAEGLRSIERLKDLIKTPEGEVALKKAGGSYNRMISLGDSTAQKMRRLIEKIGDARARPMTGAAINAPEEDRYFNGLVNWKSNLDANLYSLDLEKEYFNDTINALGAGRAFNPGAQVRERDQSVRYNPEPMRQMRTLKTGERVRVISYDGGASWQEE